MSGYCLNCVPLKPGVWAIAAMQILYTSTRLYILTQQEEDQRGFYFFLHFVGHCFGLAAAGLLILGLL